MNLARIFDQAPEPDYIQAVDFLLQRRYGKTVGGLFAEDVVAAARRAGYSPRECVDWLAQIDGLS